MDYWHLTYSSDGRMPLFPDEATRRRTVRTLARVAGRELCLFGIVDDHLHTVPVCSPKRKGRLSAGLFHALRPVVRSPLVRPYDRQVKTRSHMRWLVDYLLSQNLRHGIQAHPALWSGSCFLDLVGARVVDGLRLRIDEALPRLRTREIFEAVGLGSIRELRPASDQEIRAAGAKHLVELVTAASAAGPTLSGRKAEAVRVRRVAAHLAHLAGISASEVAWALDVTPRAVQKLVRAPVDPMVVRASRLMLSLKDLVQKKAVVETAKSVVSCGR